MHEFDSKDLKRLFGIPASQIRALIRAGHIHPLKKAGRLSYSFQDLIVLRTAGSLRAAKIPAQRINRTLRAIRQSLPGELPLSGLSITAIGDRIVVREGRALRESDSGQYTLALDVIERGGDLVLIDPRDERRDAGRDGAAMTIAESGTGGAAGAAGAAGALDGADAKFERALALEETDPKAARAAYEACLELDADHLEARLNLGRLLHLEGRLREAEKVYRGVDLQDALLSFNLAVLLEDLEREPEAMSAYRSTLALDPGFADAHFNLARLYERTGKSKDALRHLLAYRRLMNAP
jgi:tetratricopeptide (TPR) repeat protein